MYRCVRSSDIMINFYGSYLCDVGDVHLLTYRAIFNYFAKTICLCLFWKVLRMRRSHLSAVSLGVVLCFSLSLYY